MKKAVLALFLASVLSFPLWGQGKEFVLSAYYTDSTFNPIHSYYASEAQIYSALFEGLVSYHPFTLDPLPGLAKNWETAEEGKIYRFYIRSGARYSNGDHITADHIKDTWLALLNPERKAEYSFLLDIVKGAQDYRTGKTEDPNTVAIRAISEALLEVELTHPADYFLKVLCHHSFVPIHPDLLAYRDFKKAPELISNGPFYLFSYSEEELVLKKNHLYWDQGKVQLESIKITFNPDPQLITDQFNKGDIHWASAAILWNEIADPETIILNQLYSTTYYFFNCRETPWKDPRVRRALALSVPWQEIRSEAHQFFPTETLVPRVTGYPRVKGISDADPAEAQRLLMEAGFPEGRGLPEIRILIPVSEGSQREAEIMKKAWEESLGCTVLIETAESSVYFERLKEPGYTLATLTWIGDFADPLAFLQMWTADSNINDAGYTDEEFDRKIFTSMGESEAKRYLLLGEAEEYLLSQAAVLPVAHSPAFNCVDLSQVEGWFPNPLDIHPFKWIRFTGPRKLPGITMKKPGAPAPREAVRKGMPYP